MTANKETLIAGQVAMQDNEWEPWQPPCVERHVPGVGATYVHGYTAADAARWKEAAKVLAGGREPGRDHLETAQAAFVCRVAPGSPRPTFVVSVVNGPEDYRWLRERLPGRFLAAVCEESDALALEGYLPAALEGRSAEAAAAEERLGLQLADPEFWTAMSVVSCKLYGVPLSENGRPLGDVLNHLRLELTTQRQLVEALAGLVNVVRATEV